MFVFTQMIDSPDVPPVFRSDANKWQAIEPTGEIDTPPTLFVWRASDDASFYRFELFDATSVSVFQHVTADTILAVEASSVSAPSSGYWTVTPLNDLRVTSGESITTRYNTTQ